MIRVCYKCGDAISSDFQTEAYWKVGPNEEDICGACGDGILAVAFAATFESLAEERQKAQQNQAVQLLGCLREVLEQGHWYEDGEGFTMTGGFWLDSETFAALFPDWPATHPHVESEATLRLHNIGGVPQDGTDMPPCDVETGPDYSNA